MTGEIVSLEFEDWPKVLASGKDEKVYLELFLGHLPKQNFLIGTKIMLEKMFNLDDEEDVIDDIDDWTPDFWILTTDGWKLY